MKYLGEETKVEVVTKSRRTVEYIRCDKCGKKILPHKFGDENSLYVCIHTWHNDWGSESCESHDYKDYCKECAKEVVSDYITQLSRTKELELHCEYLCDGSSYDGYAGYVDGYKLAADDKTREVNENDR